jgi:threonine synthase
VKAVTYVARNGGYFVTVTDTEIITGILTMARQTGVFAEPAGAAPFAGMVKLVSKGELSGRRVAVMVTGNGLKDIVAARKAVEPAIEIEPSLIAVEEHL